MKKSDKTYIAIDLKTFYASVECVERGLDPLKTNLVVADTTRTEKTICLAVSPPLKACGISGRARLFEVIQAVNYQNALRKKGGFSGESFNCDELKKDRNLKISFIIAPPQMAKYMAKSTEIYSIYLKYAAPEDIHVYSVDEVFIDATEYLKLYSLSAREFVQKIILSVFEQTGITATAGIGSNLYLAKVAMDIVAKHIPADKNGVRIAELDERKYKEQLWAHTPITDFWRVGDGTAKRLKKMGIYTMGDIARCSLDGENSLYGSESLYKEFGVNAELLIDHAWGWEPCTIKDIKEYRSEEKSVGSGQVLHCPYNFENARIIVKEMADSLAFNLFEKGLVINKIILDIGFDTENLTFDSGAYKGETVIDRYGRRMPKPAHGIGILTDYTSLSGKIISAAVEVFDRIADKNLTVRRINIAAASVIREEDIPVKQLDMFSDGIKEEKKAEKENSVRRAMGDIKKKYGKNALLKGMNMLSSATQKDRNSMIGGHKV